VIYGLLFVFAFVRASVLEDVRIDGTAQDAPVFRIGPSPSAAGRRGINRSCRHFDSLHGFPDVHSSGGALNGK